MNKYERDGFNGEFIEVGEECFYIESFGVFVKNEKNLKKFLIGKGWTEEEIEEARTGDEDEENVQIYFTTYGG